MHLYLARRQCVLCFSSFRTNRSCSASIANSLLDATSLSRLYWPQMSPLSMVSLCCLDMTHRKLNSPAGIFPGRGSVIWRDWYTHDVVNATPGANTTLPAPLGHINVHLRDGSAILLHAQPAYTVEETRQGPFSLLVSQSSDGKAFGTAFIDDGISNPPGPSKTLSFVGSTGQLQIRAKGTFVIKQILQDITILGVNRLTTVTLHGETVKKWAYFEAQRKLVISEVNWDLNKPVSLSWK